MDDHKQNQAHAEGTGRDGDQSTPVDPEIINDVARRYPMGAGALAELLEGLTVSEDLDELSGTQFRACREALERHGKEAAKPRREEWEGITAFSDELDTLVTVTTVHDQHPDEVVDGYQTVTVELQDGSEETTTLKTLYTDSTEISR